MILQCYVDDQTYARLRQVATETGRTIEDLAEASISEAALAATRFTPPARSARQ